jgi:hypothetical protein
MCRDWVASSSLVCKSSTSHRLLRVFLEGGGADGEEDCAGGGAALAACSRGQRRRTAVQMWWCCAYRQALFEHFPRGCPACSNGDAELDSGVSWLTVPGNGRKGRFLHSQHCF